MNDHLLDELALLPEMVELLDHVRERDKPTDYFGRDQATAERSLRQVCDPIMMAAGLALNRIDSYHWFLREVAALLRKRYGYELAFNTEMLLRKWKGYGLDERVMQVLLVEVWKRIDGMVRTEPLEPGSGPETGFGPQAEPTGQAEDEGG